MNRNKYCIAVVEDDTWFRNTVRHRLEMNPENTVVLFEDGTSFKRTFKDHFDLVLLDLSLPDITGRELFEFIQSKKSAAQVVVVSGQDDINLVVELLKKGVTDYIVKDEKILDRIWSVANSLRNGSGLKIADASTQGKINSGIVGNCQALKKAQQLIQKAARSSITVVISGETGTGKELVAKEVHALSERRKKPFVAVNVAAIPQELLESELFGHEKGAFTGAVNRRIGKFEEANGGTLFLDEIAEMNLYLQAKLLRVLQERELTRVGGSETVKLDFRIIIASHKNLAREVEKKNFRQDLFYRLLGLTIDLPPLRERPGDIELLANHFLEMQSLATGAISVFSDAAMAKLKTHNFPGNVRELRAVVELAAALSENSPVIEAADIAFEKKALKISEDDSDMTLDDYNRNIIMHYLRKYDHKVMVVAEKLGIGKSTIYNLLKTESVKHAISKVYENH